MRSKAIGGKTNVWPPKRRPAGKDFSIPLLELIFRTNLFIDLGFALLKQIVSNSVCSFLQQCIVPQHTLLSLYHFILGFTWTNHLLIAFQYNFLKPITQWRRVIIFNNRHFNIDLTVISLVSPSPSPPAVSKIGCTINIYMENSSRNWPQKLYLAWNANNNSSLFPIPLFTFHVALFFQLLSKF